MYLASAADVPVGASIAPIRLASVTKMLCEALGVVEKLSPLAGAPLTLVLAPRAKAASAPCYLSTIG